MISSSSFPTDIHSYFTTQQHGETALRDAEKEIAKIYGAKRYTDFCTGRYCLRQCTGRYGYDGDILIGERGMPLLPPHISASLSHSRQLSGAIAADKNHYRSLGLDIETCGRVTKEMWHLLFSKDETNYLNSLDDATQSLHSTYFFSLKEAFYKMQFPLSGIFLDFHDVEVSITDGRYYMRTLRPVGNIFTHGQLTEGNVILQEDNAVTYFCLK